MRVFACKDLDGDCCIIRGTSDPKNPRDFYCEGKQSYVTSSVEAEAYCSTLTPGTFRELKKLDVVSGEFEFVEVPKVKGLREAWEAYKSKNITACNHETNELYTPLWRDLADAIDRELTKPAPRYDEKLIDELLEVGKSGPDRLIAYLMGMDAKSWNHPENRRAAEILQALKRAKEGV